MRVDHVFDAIGDDLARGQAVEHAVVAHRDAVVDRDGVELLGDATRGLDLAGHELAEILQVDMARYELREAVDHGDDRLAEIAVLHARGSPQAAGPGHVAAMGRRTGSIGGHRTVPGFALVSKISGGSSPPCLARQDESVDTPGHRIWKNERAKIGAVTRTGEADAPEFCVRRDVAHSTEPLREAFTMRGRGNRSIGWIPTVVVFYHRMLNFSRL